VTPTELAQIREKAASDDEAGVEAALRQEIGSPTALAFLDMLADRRALLAHISYLEQELEAARRETQKLEGDLLEECTKRVEAEANVRNLERINRALVEVVERQNEKLKLIYEYCEYREKYSGIARAVIGVIGQLPSPPGAGT